MNTGPIRPELLEYNIDTLDTTSVEGWVLRRDNPGQRLAVLLLRDGLLLASQLVDEPRPDVERMRGVPNAGFRIRFPHTQSHRLSLLAVPAPQHHVLVLGGGIRSLLGIYDLDLLFDKRWRGVDGSDEGLTWGVLLEGDSFFDALANHADLAPARSILEIGPGYGRLLEAMVRRPIRFDEYLGVDISPQKVRRLSDRFRDRRVRFMVGDCRSVELQGSGDFDLLISSATFEHLRPDFGAAIGHLRQYMGADALYAFDLTDCGDDRDEEGMGKGGEFVRHYSREAIRSILGDLGFHVQALVSYDITSIEHARHAGGEREDRLTRDLNVSYAAGQAVVVHRFMVIARAG